MSTLSKKEQHQQEMVNIAYARINAVNEYMAILESILSDNISEEEKAEVMQDMQEAKASMISATYQLDEALDNMLGINEEDAEPSWIVKPNLWAVLTS